jgi:hypothetical protein
VTTVTGGPKSTLQLKRSGNDGSDSDDSSSIPPPVHPSCTATYHHHSYCLCILRLCCCYRHYGTPESLFFAYCLGCKGNDSYTCHTAV